MALLAWVLKAGEANVVFNLGKTPHKTSSKHKAEFYTLKKSPYHFPKGYPNTHRKVGGVKNSRITLENTGGEIGEVDFCQVIGSHARGMGST